MGDLFMKFLWFAGAALVLGAAFVPSAALGDGYVIMQCDDTTCYIFECDSYPIGDLWFATGCGVVHSFPRRREIGGD